jgi:hypothetical protein
MISKGNMRGTRSSSTRREAVNRTSGSSGIQMKKAPLKLKESPLSPSTRHLSSQRLTTHASWLRRVKRRYVQNSLRSILTLVMIMMMNLVMMRKQHHFKGLDRKQITKCNELTKDINEKDELLEKQKDLLMKNKRMSNLRNP